MKVPSENGPHAVITVPKGLAVFLCRCNGAVSGKVDMEALLKDAMADANVRSVDMLNDCCAEEDLDRMRLSLMSGEVDRFVVAGCSYKTSLERFRRLALSSGLDPSLAEICNIREQCAYVHDTAAATGKARTMLAVSLKRSASLQPVPSIKLDEVDGTMIIIGNGHSAAVASREAIGLGHQTMVICPCDELNDDAYGEEVITLEEGGFERFCREAGGQLTISTSSGVKTIEGGPGRFKVTIETPLGETEIEGGAIVLAMDEVQAGNPLKGGLGKKVMDQRQLEGMLRSGKRPKGTMVMLAMDRAGESAFDPMSTHEAVHNALYLKGLSPKSTVYIVTREVFAMGQCEYGYRRAQESGVKIVRTDSFPDISKEGKVAVRDVHLGETIEIEYDTVVIDSTTEVPDLKGLANVIGIPLDGRGRFMRPNAKLKPSSSLREGVFLCGTATERSLGIGPSVDARSAVVKAYAMLKGEIRQEGDKAEVWQEKCSACLTCVRTCPFSAPSIDVEGRAEIDVSLCQGCGICVGVCPSKAIQMSSFRDDQVDGQIRAALGGAIR